MNDGNRNDWVRAGIVGVAALLIATLIDSGGLPYVSDAVCGDAATRSLWCHAYAWQTLIAGSFALVAAAVAWLAAMRQMALQRQHRLDDWHYDLTTGASALQQIRDAVKHVRSKMAPLAKPDMPPKWTMVNIQEANAPSIPVTPAVERNANVATLMTVRSVNKFVDKYKEDLEEIARGRSGTISLSSLQPSEVNTIANVANHTVHICDQALRNVSKDLERIETEIARIERQNHHHPS